MLVKGSIPEQGTGDLSEIKQEYKAMFEDMFSTSSSQALGLHKLITLNDRQTLELISPNIKKNVLGKVVDLNEELRLFFDDFMSKDMGLDEQEINWIRAFTQMALGNLDGFYFIAKQHNISYADSNTYKAICAENYEDMEDFFFNINALVPRSISKDIIKVLRKDIDGVCNIFLSKGGKQKKQKIDEDDILLEEQEEEKISKDEQRFRETVHALYDLMMCQDINEIKLKKLVCNLEMNKEIMDIILGFKGLLNADLPKVLNMFKSLLRIIGQSDEYDYVKNVINFAAFNNSDEALLSLVYEIAEKKNLDLAIDDLEYEEQLQSSDFKFLSNLNKAIDGNLDSLGYIWDAIYFKNESRILTVIGSLFKKETGSMTFGLNTRDSSLAGEVFKLEISALLDTIYRVVWGCEYDSYGNFNNDNYALLGLSLKKGKITKDFNNQLRDDTVKIKSSQNSEYLIQETESLFESSLNWIKRELRNSNDIVNIKKMTYEKRNFEMKFKSQIRNASLKHDFLKLNEGKNKNVHSKSRLKELESMYGYSLKENSVIFKIPKMFELILTAVSGDSEALFTLIEMLLPLYREIIGAPKFFEVMMSLLKENQEKLVKMIPTLVKTVTYSAIRRQTQDKTALTDQDIVQIEEEFEIKPSHIDAVSTWIRTMVILSSNNKNLAKADYERIMLRCCKSLSVYEDEIGRKKRLIWDYKRQADFLVWVLGLCQGNFSMMESTAKQLGSFEHEKIIPVYKEIMKFQRKFTQIEMDDMEKLPEMKGDKASMMANQTLGNFKSKFKLQEGVKGMMDKNNEEIKELSKANVDASFFKELFKKFDKDGNGSLSYDEFNDLCKNMGLMMSDEEALELFSKVDQDKDNKITLMEFEDASRVIIEQVAKKTLTKLGLTLEDLIRIGVTTLLFLMLILSFIFLGIMAFSKAEGFNAMINSLFPCLAGVGTAVSSLDVKSAAEKVKKHVKKVLQFLKSKVNMFS